MSDNENLYLENLTKEDLDKIYNKYAEVINQRIFVLFTNKIKQRVEEFQRKTGTSKEFIAKRLGMSKQALSESFKSDNPKIETLIKFAICLGCNVDDLYEYDQISELSEKQNNNTVLFEK